MTRLPLWNTLIIFAITLAAITGCNDEKYSSDPSHLLSFSTDTIYMDTLLTNVGTATYQLKVYNRNESDLLISSIQLADGANSGFRINVDGMKGNRFYDIDLPSNDSLYIFIEATLPIQQQDGPVFCKDSIVFLTNGKIQDVKLLAFGENFTAWHGKTITEDTLVDSPIRPIVIYDSLVIASNACLTVHKGTRFYFHGKAGLRIDGRLITEGTLEQPVVFRGDRTDRMFSYLPYDRLPGQWGGIHITGESYENHLTYTDIHGGSYGIVCDSTASDRIKISIENSKITQIAGDALSLINAKGSFTNSEFSNAQGYCVRLLGGDYSFVHCTLANYYSWDIRNGTALAIANHQNDTAYPLTNASFRNCLIAGSGNDEISGDPSKDETIPFRYFFSHCLINSEETTGEQIINVIWKKDDKFRLTDSRTQSYDFRPDSLSAAINLGSPEDARSCPTDLRGISRLSDEAPDAGCYEWQPSGTTQIQSFFSSVYKR